VFLKFYLCDLLDKAARIGYARSESKKQEKAAAWFNSRLSLCLRPRLSIEAINRETAFRLHVA
jgi:hypothetical protein